MLTLARQALMFAVLSAVAVSVTSPAAHAQPTLSTSTYCTNLAKDIRDMRSITERSRSNITALLASVDKGVSSSQAVRAQVVASLRASLYTGDAAHLDALVRLYVGTCVTLAQPR